MKDNQNKYYEAIGPLVAADVLGLLLLFDFHTKLDFDTIFFISMLIVFYTLVFIRLITDNKEIYGRLKFVEHKTWDNIRELGSHHKKIDNIHDVLDKTSINMALKINPCPLKVGDVILIRGYKWWEKYDWEPEYSYSNIHVVYENKCNGRPYKAIIKYITYNIEHDSWVIHVTARTSDQRRILLKGLKYKKLSC